MMVLQAAVAAMLGVIQTPQAPTPTATVTSTEMIGSLDIPDEIAPAAVPYMLCLSTSAGVPTYSDGKLLTPLRGMEKGTDCTKTREIAARNAEKLLRQARRGSAKERKAFVEQALSSIDDHHRTIYSLRESQPVDASSAGLPALDALQFYNWCVYRAAEAMTDQPIDQAVRSALAACENSPHLQAAVAQVISAAAGSSAARDQVANLLRRQAQANSIARRNLIQSYSKVDHAPD